MGVDNTGTINKYQINIRSTYRVADGSLETTCYVSSVRHGFDTIVE